MTNANNTDNEILDPSILNWQRERIVRNYLLSLDPDFVFSAQYVQEHAPMGTRPGDVAAVIGSMLAEGLIVTAKRRGEYTLAVVQG